jgi:hypothetical protein
LLGPRATAKIADLLGGGVRTEGYLLLPDGYPTEIDRVSNQADRERTARLSKE